MDSEVNLWKNKKNRFKLYLNTLSKPWFFLPLSFVILNSLISTNLDNFNNIIMLSILDFDQNLETWMNLLGNCIFTMFYFAVMTSSFAVDSNYLMVLGPTIGCLFNFFLSFSLYSTDASQTMNSIMTVLFNVVSNFGLLIPLGVLWSRLSKHFVDGFETTGAGIMAGMYDLGVIGSYWLSGEVMEHFQVKVGYFQRMQGPLIGFISAEIVLILCSFLFLYKKPTIHSFWL